MLTPDSSANTYNERDALQLQCWPSIESIFESKLQDDWL